MCPKQTTKEIFNNIMHYEKPERMFIWHWTWGAFGGNEYDTPGTQFWGKTIKRWWEEGLPKEKNTVESVNNYFNVDNRLSINLKTLIWPQFPEKIIEEKDGYTTGYDISGILRKRKIGEDFETSLPQYIKYPIDSRDSWKRFAKERLNFDVKGRDAFEIKYNGTIMMESYPGADNFQEAKNLINNSDSVVEVLLGSVFGILRNWMGLEKISFALYEDILWVEEMMNHLTDLLLSVLERVIEPLNIKIDHAQWWEDMCYNNGSLISPKHVKQLMLPNYKRVNEYLNNKGTDIISVDSDGFIDELIPLWLEAGINTMNPNEVASGMDVVKMRKKYGRNLRMIGGIDKRVLAEGKEAIDKELDYKIPLIAEGGYIPAVDHSVPYDISFDNYMYYHNSLIEKTKEYICT
ncbi:uroporphyrinogen decarboxylase family protein [Actinomycetota bacterium]